MTPDNNDNSGNGDNTDNSGNRPVSCVAKLGGALALSRYRCYRGLQAADNSSRPRSRPFYELFRVILLSPLPVLSGLQA